MSPHDRGWFKSSFSNNNGNCVSVRFVDGAADLQPAAHLGVETAAAHENLLGGVDRDVKRQRQAGFSHVDVTYTGFFPGPLKGLRPFEPLLGKVPVGAQYYTLAQA